MTCRCCERKRTYINILWWLRAKSLRRRPLFGETLVVRVSGTRPLVRVTMVNNETLPYLVYYGPADLYRTSHNRWRSPVPVTAAFVPAGRAGEGWRGASDEKPRGTRFLRTCRRQDRPVRPRNQFQIFLRRPAGLGRRQIRTELPPPRPGDALLKTGNVARKATAPTVRRRPDTLTAGRGVRWPAYACVCVSTVCEYCIRPTNRRRRYYYYYYYRKYNNIIFIYIYIYVYIIL